MNEYPLRLDLRYKEISFTYNHRVVAFTLLLLYVDNNNEDHCIYRVDCAHPEPDIHEHICSPNGDNLGARVVLESIPSDGTGREFVNRRYYEYQQKILDKANSEYERWCSEL